jgi:protein-arginine deiminase
MVTLPLPIPATNESFRDDDAIVGRIYAESPERVRIFWKRGHATSSNGSTMVAVTAGSLSDGEEWVLIDRQVSFNATALGRGLVLAVDGHGVVSDSAVWDGSVKIHSEVGTAGSDNQTTARDSVELRQAPVLVHHHLQPAETILSTAPGPNILPSDEGVGNATAWQAHFVEQISEAAKNEGLPLVLFNQTSYMDIWAQDFLEPGPNGMVVSIRIALRSAQAARIAGRQVFTQLRGPGEGGVQPGSSVGSGFGWEEIDSGGNIETIPPYVSDSSGKAWPNGRVIMGCHSGVCPAGSMVRLMSSQGPGGQSLLFHHPKIDCHLYLLLCNSLLRLISLD